LALKAGRSPDGDFIFNPKDSLGFLIRDAHRAFCKQLGARIVDDGVTIGMWFFLRVLWEEDGLSQRELSRRIGMMEPTTVSAIDTMVKRGFVVRLVDGDDKRRRLVRLTPKGRKLKQKLLPLAYEVNLDSAKGFGPEEIETLQDLLLRLKENMSDGK
jgi:DNA-binding MarR family transcriptional regulator